MTQPNRHPTNPALFTVSAVIGAAVEWGACESNPARDYNRRLTRERREAIHPPSSVDAEAVVTRCPGIFADMVRFLAQTGCRQKEAAGLTWGQVNLKAGTVTFLKTKTSRPRTIRLEAATVEMLAAFPRFLGSDAVFWHEDGVRYMNVAPRIREMVRSAQKAGTAITVAPELQTQ